MGGIDETNFGEIQNIGFSNIALQSAIWKAPEPIVAYKNMVDFSENPYKAVKLKVV
jgi:thiamine monophosphate synthase